MRSLLTMASIVAGVSVLSAAILLNCGVSVAQAPRTDQCNRISDIMQNVAEEFRTSVLTATLRKGEKARYIFFVGKNQIDVEGDLPWLLVSLRSTDNPEIYCTIGRGHNFQLLASLDDTNFEERFGLPGSGYPRCSNVGDVLGSLKVRAWAGKELGKGDVMSFWGDSFGYVLLTADKFWVLLKKDNAKIQTCYFDRGDDFLSQTYDLRR